MVNNDAQLYTIEGLAAAILMVVTAYFVINSTTLLTPGDTHITDMQLEQLGADVLRMMDTAPHFDPNGANIYERKESFLEDELSRDFRISNEITEFTQNFNRTFHDYAGESLHVYPTVYYWDGGNVQRLNIWDFSNPDAPPVTNRDHYVTVTRWVYLNDPKWDNDNKPRSVLLEVLIWRD